MFFFQKLLKTHVLRKKIDFFLNFFFQIFFQLFFPNTMKEINPNTQKQRTVSQTSVEKMEKKRSFEKVEEKGRKGQTPASWQLIRNPGLVEAGESVCWYSFCLSLEPCFCFEEVTLLVRLDGEHPSSGYITSRFDLPQINKIEKFIVNPGFFGCNTPRVRPSTPFGTSTWMLLKLLVI